MSRLAGLMRAGYLVQNEDGGYVLTREGEAWFEGERLWSQETGPPAQKPEVRLHAEINDLTRRHPELAGTDEMDEIRAALADLTLDLRRERVRSGHLRGLFRRKMREWREHAPQYSYDEEDTEQFLIGVEHETLDDVPDLRIAGGRR